MTAAGMETERPVLQRPRSQSQPPPAHAWLDAILDAAVDPIIGLTPAGVVTAWNGAAERLLGHPAATMVGLPLATVVAAPATAALESLWERAGRGERLVGMAVTCRTRDGREITGTLTLSPVRDDAGEVAAIVATVQQLSDSVADRPQPPWIGADLVPAVIYSEQRGDTPILTYMSPYVESLLGVSVADFMANHTLWLDHVHPEDREYVRAAEAMQHHRDEPLVVEYRMVAADGSVVWVHDMAVLVRDAAGVSRSWQGVAIDVTARKELERALESSEARYRTLVEHLPAVVYEQANDERQTSTYFSPQFEALTGFSMAEIMDQPPGEQWHDFLHPDDRQRVAAAEEESIASEGRFSCEYRLRRKDGDYIWVRDECVPVHDRAGDVVAWQGLLIDITERKRADVELRAALDAAQLAIRTRGEFLAMMSHELRTPMQAVLGYSEMLAAQLAATLTQEQQEDLRCIQQAGERMMTLVNQMLDLSRVNAGRLDLEIAHVDLAKILRQVHREVAPLTTIKGLQFHIDVPADLPPVTADPGHVHQILLNLAGNAVKFTDRGSVHITARPGQAELVVDVVDTGIGIAAEALPYVFDEFWQADSGMTRRFGGAGLGLAIARRLAELQGGRIEVSSQPGSGSTFSLRLPQAPISAASPE